MGFDWKPEQKDAIYNRGAGIAVSAAAGSGKTAVLTQRIITRLCSETDGVDLSRLAVMTYTDAAAKELRERIGSALETAVAEHPESKRLYRQLLLLPSAHISTVHSFCLDLIRTHSQALGLPSDMKVSDETQTEKIKDDLLDSLIADYYAGDVKGQYAIDDFAKFDDTFGKRGEDGVLKRTVNRLYDTFMTVPEGIGKLKDYVQAYEDAKGKDFFQTPWGHPLYTYICHFFDHYKAICGDALAYVQSVPEYKNYISSYKEDKTFIDSFSELLKKEDGVTYALCCEKITKWVVPSLDDLPRNTERSRELTYYGAERNHFKSGLEGLRDDYFCCSEADIEKAREETEKALHDLYAFLSLYEKRFAEEKRSRRLLTFADMEHFALALLWNRETDAPTDLARSVSEEYDEIYVDEFQDTNLIQQKIYRLISKEDAFFCVGDVKQSIYGFRGTDTSIFETMLSSRPVLKENSKEKCGKIILSHNFRSTGHILSFCNGIFDKLMNLNGQNRYGEGDKLLCGLEKEGEKVEICLVDRAFGTDAETSAEAEAVAEKIKKLIGTPKANGEAIRPKDIAVLLRKTTGRADLYLRAMKKRGIPCSDGNTKDFFANPEVLLACSLLQTVTSPTSDIPMAAVLKSPLYGISLDELISIRRFSPAGSLFEALCDFTEKTEFAKGKRFLADHRRWRALSSLLPCDRLIWQIFTETGIFGLCGTGENTAGSDSAKNNLLFFYRLSCRYAEGQTGGLFAFLRYIEEAMKEDKEIEGAVALPNDAVTVMTVHKSKGLEFPVVFFSETDKPLLSNTFKIDEYESGLGPTPLLLSDDGFTKLKTPFLFSALLAQKEKSLLEETRVLYVALTRARERLIIVSEVTETKNTTKSKSKTKPKTISSLLDFSDASDHSFLSRYYSYYDFLKSASFFQMMYPVLRENEDVTFTVVSVAEEPSAEEDIPSEPPVSPTEPKEKKAEPEPVSEEKAAEIVARLSASYPFEELSRIPSKLSVSELYPDVLDGADAEPTGRVTEEATGELLPPLFLRAEGEEEKTGADRGTAMHTFMQFFDLKNVDKNGVEAEAGRLIEKGFLFPCDREKLNLYKLRLFFQSPVAEQMRRASEIYREKRFLVSYPASDFTENKERAGIYRDQELLVQGIIDCILISPEGELTLLDYKTDAFSPGTGEAEAEEILKNRHRRQLGYYRYACEKMFGKPVSHTLIYSFALNREVELFF